MAAGFEQPSRIRHRFPRRVRLGTSGDFTVVYGARVSRRAGPLHLFARPNSLGHPRLGLSVGRRVGGAVVRNRVKRRLREAFRLVQRELPAGYDLVVNVAPHEPLAVEAYRRLILEASRALDKAWRRRDGTAREE